MPDSRRDPRAAARRARATPRSSRHRRHPGADRRRPRRGAGPGAAREPSSPRSPPRYALVGCCQRPAARRRAADRRASTSSLRRKPRPRAARARARWSRGSTQRSGHRGRAAAGFVERLDAGRLDGCGLRIEDKGPIQAIHWRGAPDDELAEGRAREVAELAAEQGLLRTAAARCWRCARSPRSTRAAARAAARASPAISAALFGGDDTTDLDAFTALRELLRRGELEHAVCVGGRLGGGTGRASAASRRGGRRAGGLRSTCCGASLMLFCDLLRVTVLLIAGVATALGAVSVIVANRDSTPRR